MPATVLSRRLEKLKMAAGPDPKQIAALIVGKAKGAAQGPPAGPDDEGESGNDEGMQAACEDMLNAIDKKDPQALCQALQSFFQMCDTDHDGT